jgi:Cdc6-like AAA superfamily ATPase
MAVSSFADLSLTASVVASTVGAIVAVWVGAGLYREARGSVVTATSLEYWSTWAARRRLRLALKHADAARRSLHAAEREAMIRIAMDLVRKVPPDRLTAEVVESAVRAASEDVALPAIADAQTEDF